MELFQEFLAWKECREKASRSSTAVVTDSDTDNHESLAASPALAAVNSSSAIDSEIESSSPGTILSGSADDYLAKRAKGKQSTQAAKKFRVRFKKK